VCGASEGLESLLLCTRPGTRAHLYL
jgi:hypothetical protein